MSPSRQPRLRRGLAIVPAGGALLVDGAPRRHRFTGAGSAALLPRVLPLIDGSRDAAAVAAEAGLSESGFERLLSILEDCDLLEWIERTEGSASLAGPSPDDHVATYFSRTMPAAAGACCAEDFASALDGAAVLIIADAGVGEIGEQMAADLLETGVGHVQVRAAPGSVEADDVQRLAGAARPLVAVLDDGRTALPEMLSLLRGSSVPVLRFAGGPDRVEVGPVFHDSWTTCVDCFRSDDAALSDVEPSAFTAVLATAELLAMLVPGSTQRPPWRMIRVSASTGETARLDVTSRPGCPNCAQAAPRGSADEAESLAVAYERQHEFRPEPLSVTAPITRAQVRRIAAMQHERDPLMPGPTREFPSARTTPRDARAELGPELLAEILARTAGLRAAPYQGGEVERWAPSGGNLGSVQLCVAAERDVFGLPGTLFRYDDLGHRATPIRKDRIPLHHLAADIPLEHDDVAVIFIAAIGRLGRKYGDFAPRLSHLDAGCAALQLSVASAARGVTATFASTWSTDLPNLLELEPGGEVVTALAVLHPMQRDGSSSCR
jgi:hypothetical protein